MNWSNCRNKAWCREYAGLTFQAIIGDTFVVVCPVPMKMRIAMPRGDYKRGEAADLGRAIYIKKIKPQMSEEDIGKFVAIDVDTEDYEVGMDIGETIHTLRLRKPNGVLTGQRVGYRTPFSLVPRRPDDV